MEKIVIIGGGASGLLAAIYAKSDSNEVIILERNDTLGKKILATGNGRCNYWNSNQELDHYHSSNKELISNIINSSNQKEILNFFDKLGIVPKIKNGYYYPYSNQASSIRNSLIKEIEKLNIKVITNYKVTEIIKKDKFIIYSDNNTIEVDKIIIATGGKASPKTGSDGIGYDLVKSFNHTIIKPLPALVQLKSNAKFLKDWDGIRSDCIITHLENDKIIATEEGEIQLTSYGISGICTFNLSSKIIRGLDKNNKEEVIINFLPFLKEEPLNWFKERSKKMKNPTIENLLEGIINYKLIKVILTNSNINKDRKFNTLTEEEVKQLVKNMISLKLSITDYNSFDNAQTTSGGVPLTEIDLSTCESKKMKNLYLTGELLDIDGTCGGYNLGFAWISGMLAGKASKGE